MNTVFAFECNVAGRDWQQTINARSYGRAKSEYHRSVTDAWPDIPFTAIRCRKLGGPRTSERFKSCAEYRGLPGLSCGQRVLVGAATGVVVGHNSGACFKVLFDDDSPKYAGATLPVHHQEMTVIQ